MFNLQTYKKIINIVLILTFLFDYEKSSLPTILLTHQKEKYCLQKYFLTRQKEKMSLLKIFLTRQKEKSTLQEE